MKSRRHRCSGDIRGKASSSEPRNHTRVMVFPCPLAPMQQSSPAAKTPPRRWGIFWDNSVHTRRIIHSRHTRSLDLDTLRTVSYNTPGSYLQIQIDSDGTARNPGAGDNERIEDSNAKRTSIILSLTLENKPSAQSHGYNTSGQDRSERSPGSLPHHPPGQPLGQ